MSRIKRCPQVEVVRGEKMAADDGLGLEPRRGLVRIGPLAVQVALACPWQRITMNDAILLITGQLIQMVRLIDLPSRARMVTLTF